MRALSIRLPHAAMILRGIKKVEYRSLRGVAIRGGGRRWPSESSGTGLVTRRGRSELVFDLPGETITRPGEQRKSPHREEWCARAARTY